MFNKILGVVILFSFILCVVISILFGHPLIGIELGSLITFLGINVAICRFVSLKVGRALPRWLVIVTALLPLSISFFVMDVYTIFGLIHLQRPLGDILIDLSISITIYTIFYCTTAVSVFGISSFISSLIDDFKSQLGTLIGILLFVGIGLVSYFLLSDPTVLNTYEASGITVSPAESIFAGGSMIFVYILGVAALVSVVWAEVSSIFK